MPNYVPNHLRRSDECLEFLHILDNVPAEFARQKLTLTDEELAWELSQSAGEQLQPCSDLMRLVRAALAFAAKYNHS